MRKRIHRQIVIGVPDDSPIQPNKKPELENASDHLSYIERDQSEKILQIFNNPF